MNSEKFIREIVASATLQFSDVAWYEIEAVLENAKNKILSVVENSWERGEGLRRIAECKLRELSAPSVPDEVGDRVWMEMLQVGFSSVVMKMDMTFYRLMYL